MRSGQPNANSLHIELARKALSGLPRTPIVGAYLVGSGKSFGWLLPLWLLGLGQRQTMAFIW